MTERVHFLQDVVTHRPSAPRGTVIGRSAKRGHRTSYNPTPVKGGRKYWKQVSKVIANPNMKHAGAGVIWNQV